MDLIKKSIENKGIFSKTEQDLVIQMYDSVCADPDSPSLEDKFNKLLEKCSNESRDN